MTAAQRSKLAALRAKTDRDLVRIIGSALEAGLLIAASDTSLDSAGSPHGRAQKIYAEARMLLPKVEGVGERRRLEENLDLLRQNLERNRAMALGSSA
jgi:hypothetical protein